MRELLLQEGIVHSVPASKFLRNGLRTLVIGSGFAIFLIAVQGIRQHLWVKEPAITMGWLNAQAKVPQMLPSRLGQSRLVSAGWPVSRTMQSFQQAVVAKATASSPAKQMEEQLSVGGPPGSETPWTNRNLESEGMKSELSPSSATGTSYVFVQRFPMARSRLVPRWIRRLFPFYHTDILVAPRSFFSADDQRYLDAQVAEIGDASQYPMTHYVKLEESWWEKQTASCAQIGYGYGECTERCCNVVKTEMPLNNRSSVVAGLDVSKKAIFLYGTAEMNANEALHTLCSPGATSDIIWSNWDFNDFHIYKNNCNTFTSTMLQNVFGLSQAHPMTDISEVGFFDLTDIMTPKAVRDLQNYLKE